MRNLNIVTKMKGSVIILLCLFGNFYCAVGYRTSELYDALNITCYGEDELKKICTSTATPTKVRHATLMKVSSDSYSF